MQHRHLTGDVLGKAEIADIIERGTLQDWVALRDALRAEPELRPLVRAVCDAYLGMPECDFPADFAFWKTYCG